VGEDEAGAQEKSRDFVRVRAISTPLPASCYSLVANFNHCINLLRAHAVMPDLIPAIHLCPCLDAYLRPNRTI